MEDKLEANSSSASVIQRHQTHYLEDAYFMFNDTIFKVPRLYLQESPVFQALFGDKVADDNPLQSNLTGDGTMDNPLTCISVSKESFVLILRALHPTKFNEIPQLLTDEWRDVLELSFKWRLDKLHDLALQRLSGMQLDAMTKLELAKRHGIQNEAWILPAIEELVKKDKQFTEEDIPLIGIQMVLRVSREQGYAKKSKEGVKRRKKK
ncbi:hypothetical protein AX17_006143 [Amanita inopinata Kibby_2008]|nr:hypothetical protein AX17_006143 [Amanita inopinata Kibby_2008]